MREFLHERLHRGEGFDKLRDYDSVAMLGCGAIGSWTSFLLTKMGCKWFILLDKDRVEEHNRSTQIWEPRDVGRSKVVVLKRLLERNGSKVITRNHEVDFEFLRTAALGTPIWVCSFDNAESRQAVLDWQRGYDYQNVLFVGMEGSQMYSECIWAENYKVPADPPTPEGDPCDYPLATSLVIHTSAITAEIVAHYMITGEKLEYRGSLLELVR